MEAVSRRRLFLLLTSVAFALWIGYLFYLVLLHDRPVIHWSPFEITKTPEIIVSRSQLLEAELVISARIDQLDGPAEECEVIWHRPGIDTVKVGPTLAIGNLWQCKESGWTGPGRYLLPLVREKDGYSIAPVPPTPGYPANSPGRPGPPRIYVDTPETRKQVEGI
jgi:hypothetical protein